MSERELLVDELVRHEGMRLKPYTDTAGKITIGCGRNLTDVGITKDEALLLLNNDIDAAVADLATFPWFATLDAVRQRALVDLRFNTGRAGFLKFKRFIAAMGVRDYSRAGDELMTSKIAPNRKQTLVRMITTGIGVLLCAASVSAQVATPAIPTSVDVLVLPATGDPASSLTVPLGIRTTVIGLTAPACNQPAVPVGPTPLINPSTVEIDDPFTAGRKCRLAMPIGLPNGTGYRAVTVFFATCNGTPCPSDRSLVGAPFFDLAGIPVRPAAPTSVVVRP